MNVGFSILFYDHFSFLVVLKKRKKIKRMGNCISKKINKDHPFIYEEDMKNVIPFLKGKTRIGLERGWDQG